MRDQVPASTLAVEFILNAAQDRRVGDQGFQAATIATVTQRTVRYEGDMPQLTDAAFEAAIKLVVDHHAQADPAPDGHHHKIGTLAPDPKSCSVMVRVLIVVFQVNRQRQTVSDFVGQRNVLPVEKGR